MNAAGCRALRRGELLQRRDTLLGVQDHRPGTSDRNADVRGGDVDRRGAARLVDGSVVRLPERAWFVAGSNVDEENHGCVPDIVVERPPQDDLDPDRDAQLERTVEVLLSRLPRDPSQLPW